jgi:hypothetical protein
MKYNKAPSADPSLTPYVCSSKKHNLSWVYSPWYWYDIGPKCNLHRRLFVGHSDILNNVSKPHVCGEDKKCSVVVLPGLYSSMQDLLCQRTRRMRTLLNAHTDTYFISRAEWPSVSYLYNTE